MNKQQKAINWWNKLSAVEQNNLMRNDFLFRHPQSLSTQEKLVLYKRKKATWYKEYFNAVFEIFSHIFSKIY